MWASCGDKGTRGEIYHTDDTPGSSLSFTAAAHINYAERNLDQSIMLWAAISDWTQTFWELGIIPVSPETPNLHLRKVKIVITAGGCIKTPTVSSDRYIQTRIK